MVNFSYFNIAKINGDSGPYDNKIQNSSVRYGRNAAANYKKYLEGGQIPPLSREYNFQTLEDISEFTKELNSPEQQRALKYPTQFSYKYLPGTVDVQNIDTGALLGSAFEEMGKTTKIPVKDFTQQLQSALGPDVSAEALDINKDSNIDIGEYATSTLVADMLSSDNTKLKKENITGTINNQGENSSLAYINSKNKAVASAEFKAIYDDFKLDEATKDFLSDPNNTVI